MPTFVTHLESAIDGTILPADRPQTLHAGRPLWVRYDLEAVGKAVRNCLQMSFPRARRRDISAIMLI